MALYVAKEVAALVRVLGNDLCKRYRETVRRRNERSQQTVACQTHRFETASQRRRSHLGTCQTHGHRDCVIDGHPFVHPEDSSTSNCGSQEKGSEPSMQHGFWIVSLHQARIHLDLMGQSHAAIGVYKPNRAIRCCQCINDPLQHCRIIFCSFRI